MAISRNCCYGSKGSSRNNLQVPIAKSGKIKKKTEQYEERFANPFIAAEKGYIDDVIMPRSSRKRLVRAFKSLKGKKVNNPWKKHDNIPL